MCVGCMCSTTVGYAWYKCSACLGDCNVIFVIMWRMCGVSVVYVWGMCGISVVHVCGVSVISVYFLCGV